MPNITLFSDESRSEHPHVKHIPDWFWDTCGPFSDYHISEYILTLIEIDSLESAIQYLDEHVEILDEKDLYKGLSWLLYRFRDASPIYFYEFCTACSKTQINDLFKVAGIAKRQDVLAFCLEQSESPDQRNDLLTNASFHTFRVACRFGHTNIARLIFENLDDDQRIEALKAKRSDSIKRAYHEKHIETANWLMSETPTDIVDGVFSSHQYKLTKKVLKQNNRKLIALMFRNSPAAFRCAIENKSPAWDEDIADFIDEIRIELITFLESGEALQNYNLITPDVTVRYFYAILKHLITLPAETQLPFISLLLSHPVLRDKILEGIEEDTPNALYHLAQRYGNYYAAGALLSIDAVFADARAHDFFLHGDFDDLGFLVRNSESSMQPFSDIDISHYREIRRYYAPVVRGMGGNDAVLKDLKQTLGQLYRANPAYVEIDGLTIFLPLSDKAFDCLIRSGQFSGVMIQSMLEAYYKNPVHTAFRYLSIPNYWMSPNASYVIENTRTMARWADFDRHKSTIAAFWAAVCDERIPPTNGLSLEERKMSFINGLTETGRAHNWDKTRRRLNEDEEFIRYESYDDMEGDKPSCVQGVLKRLYTSVLGHPMFDKLDEDRLEQEIQSFAHRYFLRQAQQMSPEELREFKEGFEAHALDLLPANRHLLSLNIPFPKIRRLEKQLSRKYGAEFFENPRLLLYLARRTFVGYQESHVIQFMKMSIDEFIDQVMSRHSETSTIRFFSDASETSGAGPAAGGPSSLVEAPLSASMT